jgi:ATP-binding cassette, subfamily B, bacterial PglK
MIDDWRKLLSFFSAGEKRQLLLLLLSTTVSGLVQAVGVASIMPFIAVVTDPTLVTENHYLAWAYGALGFTSTNDFLKFLGLAAFSMLLATNLLVGINAWLTFRVCHLGEYNLARRLMSRYLARPYLFLLQRNSSELVKMVVAEIDRVAIGTLMAGINVFSDAVTTLFIVVLLVVIQPWVMTVTLVVLAVAYLLIYLLIMPRVTRLGAEFATLNTEIYKNAHEAIGAAKAIKVLGREAHFVERFSRPLLRSSRNAITYSTLDIVPAQSLELVAFGGLVFATVYLIGDTGNAGEILPVIAMLAYAAYRLIPALQGLFDGVEAIRYKTAALDGLWQDYSDPGTAPAVATGDSMVPRHSIRLENVSFVARVEPGDSCGSGSVPGGADGCRQVDDRGPAARTPAAVGRRDNGRWHAGDAGQRACLAGQHRVRATGHLPDRRHDRQQHRAGHRTRRHRLPQARAGRAHCGAA